MVSSLNLVLTSMHCMSHESEEAGPRRHDQCHSFLVECHPGQDHGVSSNLLTSVDSVPSITHIHAAEIMKSGGEYSPRCQGSKLISLKSHAMVGRIRNQGETSAKRGQRVGSESEYRRNSFPHPSGLAYSSESSVIVWPIRMIHLQQTMRRSVRRAEHLRLTVSGTRAIPSPPLPSGTQHELNS